MKVHVLVSVEQGQIFIAVHKNLRRAYAAALEYANGHAEDNLEESFPGDWQRLFALWQADNDEGCEASLWEMYEEYIGETEDEMVGMFEGVEVFG